MTARKKPRPAPADMPAATPRLLEALDGLASAVAVLRDAVETALRGPPPTEWISQKVTPLTKRAHCALTRRLVAEGHPGACISGRRYLLTLETIAEHRRGMPADTREPVPASAVDRLKAKLVVLRGGREPVASSPVEALKRELEALRARRGGG